MHKKLSAQQSTGRVLYTTAVAYPFRPCLLHSLGITWEPVNLPTVVSGTFMYSCPEEMQYGVLYTTAAAYTPNHSSYGG